MSRITDLATFYSLVCSSSVQLRLAVHLGQDQLVCRDNEEFEVVAGEPFPECSVLVVGRSNEPVPKFGSLAVSQLVSLQDGGNPSLPSTFLKVPQNETLSSTQLLQSVW